MGHGQLYQIQPCHNCKADCWRLEARLDGAKTEYICFYCGAVLTAREPERE